MDEKTATTNVEKQEEKVVFKVSRNDILVHLTRVSKVVPNRTTLPVLTYILAEVKDGVCSMDLTGNNQEQQIETSLELVETSGSMSFCIDRSIVDVLKTLPEQPLEFEVVKTTTISVENDRKVQRITLFINMKHSTGKVSVPGLLGDDYPKLNDFEGESFEIPISNLKRGFAKTKKFIGFDELRPIVSNIYIDITHESITFVATDGRYISRMVDKSLQGIGAKSSIIHIDAVNLIYPILENTPEESAKITVSKNNISVEIGEVKIISRLTEGNYVRYNSVFPSNNSITMTVNSKALSNVINRLMQVSNPASMLIKIDATLLDVVLSAQDIDYQKSAYETIDATCDSEITVGVKGSQLLDILNVISENAILRFSDATKPILITPEKQDENTEHTLLLLPVMLGD